MSIIIPVYKVETYLRQCLDSIINQTYQNLEIIIIDDGSPDLCGEICDEYAEKDLRIEVIHKKNEGLSAARNEGICHSTGEWIAFVDSDDWCEIDYYENIIKSIQDYSVDVVCAGARIKEASNVQEVGYAIENNFIFCNSKEIETLSIMVLATKRNLYSLNAPWDKLYRRKFLVEHQIFFDTTLKAWEDTWFNFQVFQKAQRVEGRCVVGYHYRILLTSITGSYNPKRPEINYEFICKLQDYCKKNKSSDLILAAIHARTLALLMNTLDYYFFHPQNQIKNKDRIKEFREMIRWPYYQEAIREKCNPYISIRQKILKFLLRFPSVWPFRFAYMVEKKISK